MVETAKPPMAALCWNGAMDDVPQRQGGRVMMAMQSVF
jgi:hypothetical protein